MQFVLKNDAIIERCIEQIRASRGKTVTIKETKRSNPQNALYWSILNILAKELGNHPDELHTILKVRFLGTKKRFIDGHELIEPISTTTLTVGQFTEYIDRVYALAAQLNINIPTPDYWGLE